MKEKSMLFFRIIGKDLKRNKGAMIVVFTFIMLSSLMVSSGSRLITELDSALESLFTAAKIPHFVQMHSGDFDSAELKRWSEANSLVADKQIVEMVSIDGSALFLSSETES
jgi:putative ABC transport system permease protein